MDAHTIIPSAADEIASLKERVRKLEERFDVLEHRIDSPRRNALKRMQDIIDAQYPSEFKVTRA